MSEMMDEMVNRLEPDRPANEVPNLFHLNRVDEPDKQVRELVGQFFLDDGLDRVCVVVEGEVRGTLTRRTALDMGKSYSGRIGGGEHAMLSGTGKGYFLRLECPRDDCEETVRVTVFDENDPPRCRRHPEEAMVPAGT